MRPLYGSKISVIRLGAGIGVGDAPISAMGDAGLECDETYGAAYAKSRILMPLCRSFLVRSSDAGASTSVGLGDGGAYTTRESALWTSSILASCRTVKRNNYEK